MFLSTLSILFFLSNKKFIQKNIVKNSSFKWVIKKSVKLDGISLIFKAFVSFDLFIVTCPSILFARKIVRKSNIIEKLFILILFSYT